MPNQGDQNGLTSTKDPMELLGRLLKHLERRKEDYLRVAMQHQKGEEFHTSFTARASEVGLFITDLEMLQEHVQG